MDTSTYKIIAEITDETLQMQRTDLDKVTSIRLASRCVVFHQGKVGVLFEQKASCYLLPGGGIEPGESAIDACIREVREEMGVKISNLDCLGIIIERRSATEQVKIEFVYTAYADQVGLGQRLTPNEDEAGMDVLWLPRDELLEKLESVEDVPYKARFVNRRLIKILKEIS